MNRKQTVFLDQQAEIDVWCIVYMYSFYIVQITVADYECLCIKK